MENCCFLEKNRVSLKIPSNGKTLLIVRFVKMDVLLMVAIKTIIKTYFDILLNNS